MNRGSVSLRIAMLIASVAVVASGCHVNPFCLACGEGNGMDGGTTQDQGVFIVDGQMVDVTCIPSGLEICDGLDNDCNGLVDDGIPGIGVACDVGPGTNGAWPAGTMCRPGITVCDNGGVIVCNGVSPQPEICDGLDNNCNGTVDELFNTAADPQNCGACGNNCTTLAHAIAGCAALTDGGVGFMDSGVDCVIQACDQGYYDFDPSAPGCEYACDFQGVEICDGIDNDCNGTIDDMLGSPPAICLTQGECAVADGGMPLVPHCAGTAGWLCDYTNPTVSLDSMGRLASEANCDNLDNDCNGVIDDAFPTRGLACTSGSGPCVGTGINVCTHNSAPDGGVLYGVTCNATPHPELANPPELCNGIDDDCDGYVDNGTMGSPGNTADIIPWVTFTLADGGTAQMFPYEASRADAVGQNEGTSPTACSNPGVLPWTNVTYDDARIACEDIGARLCTEDEWQVACEAGFNSMSQPKCTYSFSSPGTCNTYNADTCNGQEHDAVPDNISDPSTIGDQDAVASTGAFPACYARWGASARIYDLSGNVREWAQKRSSSGLNPLRGGAYDTIGADLACSWNFMVADDLYFFTNAGFRCCR